MHFSLIRIIYIRDVEFLMIMWWMCVACVCISTKVDLRCGLHIGYPERMDYHGIIVRKVTRLRED